ncbi:hypothetical protein ADK78_28760 [Kitasatospora aureofaciens]|uniref:Integrase n=2 Tax=Streptomyces rimosus subsp. rimosus TaxID=132474 RepID=L8EY64_STRR1|nr:hypothetical protein [Streptomyces rimosus]KOG70575.1 hypothetical protein ADK78_28760 [Kitasatospora aureofaciens]KUJ29479.1 hypothetical protein ADK46_29585 [Streptomyces rimosus subsp. rimosus]MYT47363.1 hypothetical protein [Streptomyces sp. SID5471]QGY71114.1 hypothetical protein V519_001875 [Streptomyces rimosus R6-500]QST85978.1 hypothetical protein SRIM_017660 [Streptomyces rimosus subsp. rimosus ATCC 10970]
MAYAEKRVSTAKGSKGTVTWRVRYKGPNGTWLTESGFPTKKTALDWGREQERQIKAGIWIDPEARSTTFGDFARTYMQSRRKRGRTTGTRWDRLENHILPRWEHTRLGDITWFDVDSWQQTMDVEDVSRGHCVSLMSTIMTAAVDAKKVTVNPLFGRRRTRETSGDAAQRRPQKVQRDGGARPEDAILLAERLGPAVGIHVLTTAFAGPRWGEGLGLHRDNTLLVRRQPWGAGEFVCPIIRIVEEYAEYQERDEHGNKKGYILRLEATKNDGSTRDVDVPPFLAQLLRYHLSDWPHPRIFCTPSGQPWRRGNWWRTFRPACDGREERARRRGVAHRDAWEPILPGLDMRALRALHDTMQSEIGVKEPLAFEAAGHRRPGIKRHYQKPTAAMRAERLEGLEEIFWKGMANVGLSTLWGRVSLQKAPAERVSQISPK